MTNLKKIILSIYNLYIILAVFTTGSFTALIIECGTNTDMVAFLIGTIIMTALVVIAKKVIKYSLSEV